MAKRKASFAQRAVGISAGAGAVVGLLSMFLSAIAELLFKHTSLGERLGPKSVELVLSWLTETMIYGIAFAALVCVVYFIGNFLLGAIQAVLESAGSTQQSPVASDAFEDDDDGYRGSGVDAPISMSGLYPDDDMRSEPLLDDWNSNR